MYTQNGQVKPLRILPNQAIVPAKGRGYRSLPKGRGTPGEWVQAGAWTDRAAGPWLRRQEREAVVFSFGLAVFLFSHYLVCTGRRVSFSKKKRKAPRIPVLCLWVHLAGSCQVHLPRILLLLPLLGAHYLCKPLAARGFPSSWKRTQTAQSRAQLHPPVRGTLSEFSNPSVPWLS